MLFRGVETTNQVNYHLLCGFPFSTEFSIHVRPCTRPDGAAHVSQPHGSGSRESQPGDEGGHTLHRHLGFSSGGDNGGVVMTSI